MLKVWREGAGLLITVCRGTNSGQNNPLSCQLCHLSGQKWTVNPGSKMYQSKCPVNLESLISSPGEGCENEGYGGRVYWRDKGPDGNLRMTKRDTYPLIHLLRVVIFSAYSRRLIHEYELYYRDSGGKVILDAFKFNVIITTYEVMLCECASKIVWS